jgi:SAM-dependent methyltransferase
MSEPSEVIWHEVECGSYDADLPLWEELADGTDEPILELGCGSGRVTLHLARRGATLVIGLDSNPDLVGALWERAIGTTGDAELEDVCSFSLPAEFGLALAPMQLIQLLDDRSERIECLSRVGEHLTPTGCAAFAIVEEPPPAPVEGAPPPLPDVRQAGGWIYSSLPLETIVRGDSIVVRRLRQTVSPEGELKEEPDEVELRLLSAEALEEEAVEAGLRPLERRTIPATEAHVGSTVVLLGREV